MGFRGSLSSEFLPPSGIHFAMTDSNLKRWDSYISKNLPKRVTEAATALSTAGRGGPRDRDTLSHSHGVHSTYGLAGDATQPHANQGVNKTARHTARRDPQEPGKQHMWLCLG